MIEIRNHILFIDGRQVDYRPSPNVGGIITPEYLIMHYTASKTAKSAIEWMLSKSSKVSAHLHIARDGHIVQLAPLNIKCWHAGESSWNGIIGLNSHSIGIELQNTGTEEYTEVQLAITESISKALVEKYSLTDILGHSDIAPGRKVDPGNHFPMGRFKAILSVDNCDHKETTADLNVRTQGGTQYAIKAVLPKGTIVEITVSKGDWSLIEAVNLKITGWVSNKYLK